MGTRTAPVAAPHAEAPLTVPFCWQSRGRDVALDLVRGLAMVILVVNHIHLSSPLEYATATVLSAAEALVAVSGVVVGMVFGRRWMTSGARATTVMLLARARKLYVASVVVVAVVGLLTLVPGLPTERLTVSAGTAPAESAYSFESLPRTLLAVVLLEAGPWQFSILGFFIVLLAVSPVLLWALDRGRWAWVIGASWGLYLLGRSTGVDVLPSLSERSFPVLVWQLLFVHGMVVGWHRDEVRALARRGRAAWVIAGVAAAAALMRVLSELRLEPWAAFERAYFDKAPLDPARVLGMTALVVVVYLGFRNCGPQLQERLARVLLPFGRSSFYVFIMHVFVCLAVATALPDQSAGPLVNAAAQIACLALLWTMVTRRFLFRGVPR